MAERQIKSQDRVRDLAEVYTAKREVNDMLDLVKDESYRIDSRFLEPACGNGNFLEEILLRKVHTASMNYSGPKSFEFDLILALTSIYGVDIDPQNVKESRERLSAVVKGVHAAKLSPGKRSKEFDQSVDFVLGTNIIEGDMINRVEHIQFTQYEKKSRSDFLLKTFRLPDLMSAGGDLFSAEPQPIAEMGPVHYTKLGEIVCE